jgi:hypothetical protein
MRDTLGRRGCWCSRRGEAVPNPPTCDNSTILELHTIADARERILQQLAADPEGGPLDRFLLEPLSMGIPPAKTALSA